MTDNKTIKSTLALAIESRERKLHEFDVQGFFGLGNKLIHKIGIRVAVKAEEDQALVAAHYRTKELAKGMKEAMEDFDLLGDQKLIQILHRICFSPIEKTKDGVPYPAFPGPDWMRENLTTDQIACLMNLYHEVRAAEGPIKNSIDLDYIEALSEGCAKTSGTDMPDAMLATVDRTWLTQAFVLLSIKYQDAKKELERVQRDSELGAAETDASSSGEGSGERGQGDEEPAGASSSAGEEH